MIICEIGLNHLGDTKYANQIVGEVIKAKPDAITFQILEEEFYENKLFSKLMLPDDFYKKIIKKIKNSGIKFGVALADETRIKFCKELDVDFYKILSKDITNFKLLDKILKNKKNIFISTGMSDIAEIEKTLKFVEKNIKQVKLIHTQLTHNVKDVNLKAISLLKNQFNIPISYGHHSTNHNILFLSLAYSPSDIFLYVKGNRKKHPDEEHAISTQKLKTIISNLKELPYSIGKENKIKMKDKIKHFT